MCGTSVHLSLCLSVRRYGSIGVAVIMFGSHRQIAPCSLSSLLFLLIPLLLPLIPLLAKPSVVSEASCFEAWFEVDLRYEQLKLENATLKYIYVESHTGVWVNCPLQLLSLSYVVSVWDMIKWQRGKFSVCSLPMCVSLLECVYGLWYI